MRPRYVPRCTAAAPFGSVVCGFSGSTCWHQLQALSSIQQHPAACVASRRHRVTRRGRSMSGRPRPALWAPSSQCVTLPHCSAHRQFHRCPRHTPAPCSPQRASHRCRTFALAPGICGARRVCTSMGYGSCCVLRGVVSIPGGSACVGAFVCLPAGTVGCRAAPTANASHWCAHVRSFGEQAEDLEGVWAEVDLPSCLAMRTRDCQRRGGEGGCRRRASGSGCSGWVMAPGPWLS